MANRAEEYEDGTRERTALEQRVRLINNGEYANALERNITAYMLTIDEYEAKIENRSLLDVIKGILSKDEDTKDYLKRRYMKSRAEDNGMLEIVDLNLQDPYDAIKTLFEENKDSFINLKAPETALVPVDTTVNKVFEEVREMLTEYLNENGITRGESSNISPTKFRENYRPGKKFMVKPNEHSQKTEIESEIGDEI